MGKESENVTHQRVFRAKLARQNQRKWGEYLAHVDFYGTEPKEVNYDTEVIPVNFQTRTVYRRGGAKKDEQ